MTTEELEAYFTGITLPEQITIQTGVVILDIPLFLESHFAYIRNNPGSKAADVYIQRLHQLITALEAS
jgi:hypothetical protein